MVLGTTLELIKLVLRNLDRRSRVLSKQDMTVSSEIQPWDFVPHSSIELLGCEC